MRGSKITREFTLEGLDVFDDASLPDHGSMPSDRAEREREESPHRSGSSPSSMSRAHSADRFSISFLLLFYVLRRSCKGDRRTTALTTAEILLRLKWFWNALKR